MTQPTLAQVLDWLIRKGSASENEIERETGVKQSQINRLRKGERRNPHDSTIKPLADYFGVTLSQLRGYEPIPDAPFWGGQSLQRRRELVGTIPQLSWVNAGPWGEVMDEVGPEAAEKWIPCVEPVSNDAFGLVVEGDSMEPEFPDGVTIIVEPQRAPRHKDFVVARLDNENRATFKQLVQDGGTWYLKPLNDRYPIMTLDQPTSIVGVVVGQQKTY